jgi:hypothetical protein
LGSTNGASKNHSVSGNQAVFRKASESMALNRPLRGFFHPIAWHGGAENAALRKVKEGPTRSPATSLDGLDLPVPGVKNVTA